MTDLRARVVAATLPTLLIILAIVVGLGAFSLSRSLGEDDSRSSDGKIRSVPAMLDAYYADEGDTSARHTEVRRRVQAVLDSHADR